MDLLEFAKKVALESGKEAFSYFRVKHFYHHKGEKANYATEADLASEKTALEMINKIYPDHNFLSEERGHVDKKGEFTWVMDPIDGTVNFSHGQTLWGTELAVFKGNVPVIGVICLPVSGELFYAEKGKGAYCCDRKIKVSKTTSLEESLIGLEFAYPAERKNQKMPFERIIRNLPSMLGCSQSTAYDLAALADGRIDGFIEEAACIWDIAGGSVIVEEAGGKLTDWRGKQIEWVLNYDEKHYDLIASNRVLQSDLGQALDKYLK